MSDELEFLKSYFIIKSSFSSYPVIKWLNYAPMVTEWNILDEHFKMDAGDRIYIAVTKNMNKQL